MKKKYIGSLILSSVFLVACGNEKKEAVKTEPVTATETNSPVTDSTALKPPAQSVIVPSGFPVQGATAPVAQTPVGMNPPHGEPGHRCDIAVGAPLNSPPSATGAVPVQNQPSTSITTPPVSSNSLPGAGTATAPGMNPPHGQPGHDCTIAVGAPLKK